MKLIDKYKFIKEYNYYNTSKENDIDIAYYIYNRLIDCGFEMSVSPINLGIRITNKCNFNCKDCFVSKGLNELNFDKFLKIFEKLPQKPFYVYLTGGDPFLNGDIFKMIDFLYLNNIKLNIHTTGVVEKNILYKIVENYKKINSMQISIDSINNFDKIRLSKYKDPLREIIKFIEILKNKIDLKVNFVLREENKYDIFDVINFCDKYGIKKLNISPIISKNNSSNDILNLDFYFKILKYISNKNVRLCSEPFCHAMSLNYIYTKDLKNVERFYCPAGKTECEIDINGNVYACPFLYNDDFKFGNIFIDDFESIWKINNRLTRLEWSQNEKCKKCIIYNKCGGGCCAYSYINNSEYDERCNLCVL